ncbi:hypothetical protein B0T22DRAFT_449853 [Podospora appendiculata]|uniref:Mid2 domain-containing protein n=1 Tax=Podospora appendiculata TaxID=314037 RepID=A0AAE0XHB1_9PEZI|nr:hypothetical protein B0T22DRAFT_449853 [Podospora appendiculata]
MVRPRRREVRPRYLREDDVTVRRRHLEARDDSIHIESDDDSVASASEDDDDDIILTIIPVPAATTLPVVAAPALDATSTSKSQRVIPTLTAITHAPTLPSPTSVPANPDKESKTEKEKESKTEKEKESKTEKEKDKSPKTEIDNDLETEPHTSGIRTTTFAISTTTGSPTLSQSRPSATLNSPSSSTATSVLVVPTSLSPTPTAIASNENSNTTTSTGNRGLSSGAKAGIAIGTIAGVAILVALFLVVRKRYIARFNQALPAQKPPFNGSAAQGRGPPDARTQSQILDELMAASYAHQNGGAAPAPAASFNAFPNGFMANEKESDGSYPVTIIQPIPQRQPELRTSFASWLRRHHPLKLNPLSSRGSMFSVASRATGTESNYRDTMAPDADQVPPMPAMPALAMHSAMYNGAAKSAQPGERPNYKSGWSESSDGTAASSRVSEMPTVSEGNTSIYRMYGERPTDSYQHPPFEPKRASSPVLGRM